MTDAPQRTTFAYDEWMEAQGLPIHGGYFVPDVRTIELGFWQERGCDSAFIQLVGQQGVSEARITEVKPGEVLPPYKMAVDEVVYVNIRQRHHEGVGRGGPPRRRAHLRVGHPLAVPDPRQPKPTVREHAR